MLKFRAFNSQYCASVLFAFAAARSHSRFILWGLLLYTQSGACTTSESRDDTWIVCYCAERAFALLSLIIDACTHTQTVYNSRISHEVQFHLNPRQQIIEFKPFIISLVVSQSVDTLWFIRAMRNEIRNFFCVSVRSERAEKISSALVKVLTNCYFCVRVDWNQKLIIVL